MKLTDKQIAAAWYNALQEADRSEWDTISQRYLAFIHQSGMTKRLSLIVSLIEERENDNAGVTAVTVRTAHDVDTETVNDLVSSLFPDQQVAITTSVEPELIGGVQVETKNERFDMSVSGRLRRLSQTLTQS